MANQRSRIPSYRLHKGSGQAVVTIMGRSIYLGKYGSPESQQKYRRVLTAAATGGIADVDKIRVPVTVEELCQRYLQHLQADRSSAWLKNNLPRHERAILVMEELFGSMPAEQFGPKALKLVQQSMIQADLGRATINTRVAILKKLIAWGVSEELLPASAHHAVLAVEGLRRNRSKAKESKEVLPVARGHVLAVQQVVAPPVAALIELQWLTGCRPGEAVSLCAEEGG